MRLKLVSQFALIEEVYIFQVWPGNILQVCPSQAQLGTAGIAKEQRARPRSRLRHSLSLALVIIIIITRPWPAFGRQGLDGTSGRYNFNW